MFIITLLTFYLLAYNMQYVDYGIGVIPNAGDVYAEVKEKVLAGNVAHITLHILEAKDYNSMPNFVKDQVNKDITITVSKDDLPYFEKDRVNILVSLEGDGKQQSYTAKIKP